MGGGDDDLFRWLPAGRKYDEFLAGTAELNVVFEPDEHSSLENYA